MHTKQDILDYLTWTYFFRRLLQNPSYYKLETLEPQDVNRYLSNLVQTALDTLASASCIEFQEVKLLILIFYKYKYIVDMKKCNFFLLGWKKHFQYMDGPNIFLLLFITSNNETFYRQIEF